MLDPTYRKAQWHEDVVRVRAVDVRSRDTIEASLVTTRTGELTQLREPERHWVGDGEDAFEALQSLQTSVETDAHLLCCGGCCFFQVTGMSRQMGGGTGYCLLYFPTHGRSLDDVVSLFDVCDRFVHCPGGGSDQTRMRLWEERASSGDPQTEDADG